MSRPVPLDEEELDEEELEEELLGAAEYAGAE